LLIVKKIKYLCSKSKFYTPYYQSKFAITRRSSQMMVSEVGLFRQIWDYIGIY